MKLGSLSVIAFLWLTGCLVDSNPTRRFRTSWVCAVDECSRIEAVRQYDRAQLEYDELELMSSSDDSLFTDARLVVSNQVLAPDCLLVLGLQLFEHEIESAKYCSTPSGFELTVTIPDEDPETSSTWVVMAREL
ncbi:hypothetical protein [Haliangium ochraceum]|uniref:Lipoprotein n=1 Tax=Haliangium ochraceum (strain DSM 14365 / JCM 11303 / SMP-2) TaxID=502025 RepID=D0LM11_HALO1|nr:hypothetical protein [Haliangium ochraceum]ACY15189.1 hypothetical protein Hoch_2658 [Haliangium ochraceum DSM 14365]